MTVQDALAIGAQFILAALASLAVVLLVNSQERKPKRDQPLPYDLPRETR